MLDIKKLREKTEKTQDDFAKWLHIPIKTLQKWEQSVSSPPPYVLELIEYKIFMSYMVSVPSAPSAPCESDYKTLFDLMEAELDVEPSTSKFCIYRPVSGGCAHCTKPDDQECNIKCWIRYKEFCPD